MWTPEVKNGDLTGRVLQGSAVLIQWLEEALEDEGNKAYAVIGSGTQEEVLSAVSDILLSRMEYILSCYKLHPGRFLDSQVFVGFSIVPTAEGEATVTLRLLDGSEASLLWKGGKQ